MPGTRVLRQEQLYSYHILVQATGFWRNLVKQEVEDRDGYMTRLLGTRHLRATGIALGVFQVPSMYAYVLVFYVL
ncbi:hypothetical protein M0804_000734 [Polistes exclamans]|nr:hypothetical protein M0804_000734 [Polistes exclamans]